MAKSERRIRIINNPDNELILVKWYENAGYTVKMQTQKSTNKNGTISSTRQIIINK